MLMIKHLGQPGTRVLASSSSPRFCPLNAFKYATAASVSTRAKTAPRKLSPSTPPVVAVLSSSTTSAANHHASSGRGPSNGKIRVMGGYTVAGSYSWGSSRTLPSKSAGPLIYPLGSPDFPPPMETGPDGYPYLDFRTKNSRSVYYTSDNEKADQWLHGNATRLWALDAEWTPFMDGKQGPIALIQLGDDKSIYLFHVHHMKKFPDELARILTDKRTLKVGVNIRGDGTKLMKDWGVKCTNLVELGALSIQVKDDLHNKRKIRSVDSLTRELLGHTVDKDRSVRMGDWNLPLLQMDQIAYAANDVFVAYEIAAKIKQLQTIRPERVYHVPLATIKIGGADVITVQGTLQACEDGQRLSAPNTPKVLPTSRSRSSVDAKPKPKLSSTRRSKSPTRLPDAPKKRDSVSPPAKNSTHSRKGPIHTSKHVSRSDPAEVWRAMRYGGRSVVTVIPTSQLKKSSPHARPFSSRARKSPEHTVLGDGHHHENGGRDQEQDQISIPSHLLPESMEGMSIMERNQAVWFKAGGRNPADDDGDDAKDDDWYLRQNQALFESLMTDEPGSR